MTGGLGVMRGEYLSEKEIAKGAPRLLGVFTADRLLTDNRGDFPFGGHRLSSLYRTFENATLNLMNRYFAISFSLKYSNSTFAGVTAPGVGQ